MAKLYQTVPRATLIEVYKKYKDDYELFGFDFNNVLKLAGYHNLTKNEETMEPRFYKTKNYIAVEKSGAPYGVRHQQDLGLTLILKNRRQRWQQWQRWQQQRATIKRVSSGLGAQAPPVAPLKMTETHYEKS